MVERGVEVADGVFVWVAAGVGSTVEVAKELAAGATVSVGVTIDETTAPPAAGVADADGSIAGVPVDSTGIGEATRPADGFAVDSGVALVVGALSGVAWADACTGEVRPDGEEAEDGLAGGTTKRGVSVAPGVAFATDDEESKMPAGDATDAGDAARVA
jgi:hypothetical protein